MSTNPLLLVCLAIACGAVIGCFSWRGVSLGIAGVLFAGILLGYLVPEIKPPDVLATFGLSLFVYAVGLSSARFLYNAWSKGGWRYLFVPPIAIGAAFLTCAFLARWLGIDASTAAGVFAGALTNTPALAAANTALGNQAAAATLGYALAYPLGVLIPILILSFPLAKAQHQETDALTSTAVRISRLPAAGESVTGLLEHHGLAVRFARCLRQGTQSVLASYSVINNGDLVTLVGLPKDIEAAVALLGEVEAEPSIAEGVLDTARMFASSKAVCGKTLRQIGIFRKFDGVVTRIKRGDVEFIPNIDTTVLPGDRLRVLAPRERMNEISHYLGDSYQEASEVNILTFGLGLAMGIALGAVEIVLPGGLGTFEVGPVAGCLITALILGGIGRVGALSWHLPYGASVSLRQIGLVLFLSCAGLKAGGLVHSAPLAATPILAGFCVTLVSCLVTLLLASKIAGKDWPFLSGACAGVQTQPAVLGFAVEKCGNDRVEAGYAAVYPLAMLMKIIVIQLLILALK